MLAEFNFINLLYILYSDELIYSKCILSSRELNNAIIFIFKALDDFSVAGSAIFGDLPS